MTADLKGHRPGEAAWQEDLAPSPAVSRLVQVIMEEIDELHHLDGLLEELRKYRVFLLS